MISNDCSLPIQYSALKAQQTVTKLTDVSEVTD